LGEFRSHDDDDDSGGGGGGNGGDKMILQKKSRRRGGGLLKKPFYSHIKEDDGVGLEGTPQRHHRRHHSPARGGA